MTDMVQPVMIPFLSLCHPDVVYPEMTHLEVVGIIQSEVSDLVGNMVSLKSTFNQFVQYGIGEVQSQDHQVAHAFFCFS